MAVSTLPYCYSITNLSTRRTPPPTSNQVNHLSASLTLNHSLTLPFFLPLILTLHSALQEPTPAHCDMISFEGTRSQQTGLV